MDHITMPNNVELNSWLICYEPKSTARLRLFCFPYAGGGASVFCTWAKELPSDVETIGIQMPASENRIMEPPIESVSLVVQRLLPEIYLKLDKPFVFFGHSLGALIGFELSRELFKRYSIKPVHLFVAGIRAPHVTNPNPPIHDLPEKEFLEELHRRYSGIPEEILQNPDILQVVLPGLRAGLKMSESYDFIQTDPLDCDVTAFGGYQDKTARKEDLEAWRHQTKGSFTLHMILGNHFFIHSEQEPFLRILSDELIGILSGLR